MNHIDEPASQNALFSTAEYFSRDYFDEHQRLNHLRESHLPSRHAVIRILDDVKQMLFPDHRLSFSVRTSHGRSYISETLARIHSELRQQILWARSYQARQYERDQHQDDHTPHECHYDLASADDDAVRFIESLPKLRHMLELDAIAAIENDPAANGVDEVVLCYLGYEAVTTYRIAHELFKAGIPFLPRIMSEEAHSRTGTDIHPGAKIGPSFFIDHATGVVIGGTSIIGARVTLYQGVTLGALNPRTRNASGELMMRNKKRHPTIEDDVVIYAGATVLGGETVIGARSVIGGSCWITSSVPADTHVMIQKPNMRFHGPGGSGK